MQLTVKALSHFKPSSKNNFIQFSIILGLGFLITWGYNIYNNDPTFGDSLYWLLENTEWTIGISIVIFMLIRNIKNLKNHGLEISAMILALTVFGVVDFDNSILRDLWDEWGYPSMSLMVNFYNIPPIDPFQIVMLFSLFSFKGICEKIFSFSIKKGVKYIPLG